MLDARTAATALVQRMAGKHGVIVCSKEKVINKLAFMAWTCARADREAPFLRVTSDFDRTLTGAKSVSGHGVLEIANCLSKVSPTITHFQ